MFLVTETFIYLEEIYYTIQLSWRKYLTNIINLMHEMFYFCSSCVCVLERMVHQSNQWTNGVSLSLGFGWVFFGKNGPQHRKDIGQMILFSMEKDFFHFSKIWILPRYYILTYICMYSSFLFTHYSKLECSLGFIIANLISGYLVSTSALVPRISRGIRKVNLGAPLYSWLGLSKSYKGLIIWGWN